MRFLHISDTHYLKDYTTNRDGFAPAFLNMEDPLVQLQALLEKVDEPVDFVIHSGDLTHSGGLADYQALKEGLQALLGDTPLLTTPGNHDNQTAYRAVFAPEAGAVQVTQFAGLQVIGFDSAQEGNPNGALTQETCQQLLSRLDENPTLPTVLFTHHHVLPNQFELPCATVDALFQTVMARRQVVLLVTGHTHHQYKSHYNQTPYYTGDPVSFVVECEQGQLKVYQQAGLQVFTLEDGQIHCQKVETGVAPKPLGVLQ